MINNKHKITSRIPSLRSVTLIGILLCLVGIAVYVIMADKQTYNITSRTDIESDFSDVMTNTITHNLHIHDEIQIACISLAIYGEARNESSESMTAVAYVIMNRSLTSTYKFPKKPCDVVLQAYQFESVKSTLKDMVLSSKSGDLQFPSMHNAWISRKIRDVARDVYHFNVVDPTNYATHFWSPTLQHALGRLEPTWSIKLPIVARVGSHIYHE